LDNEKEQERHIRALHDFLPTVLTVGGLGFSYAKMLRDRRQKLHPVGVEEIRTVETASGLRLNVNIGDRLGCDFFYGFFQERTEFELLMDMTEPGAVFIDVGANVGFYALEACRRAGETGRVLAIEADPRSVRLLKQNIEQNALGERLICAAVCAGPKDGEVEFFEATEPSLSGMGESSRSAVRSVLKVPMRSIDSLVSETGRPRVDLVKIDVEGFEFAVIEGAIDTLRKSDAVVMLEISSKNLRADHQQRLIDALCCLCDLGYLLFSILSDGRGMISLPHPAALFPADNPPADGSLFLARGDTGRALRLEQTFQMIAQRPRAPHGLFKNHGTLCTSDGNETEGTGSTVVDHKALEELIEFVSERTFQSSPNRQAYEDKLKNLTVELQNAGNSRQAHREQLERVLAELEQVTAGRQAHRGQLERVLAELEQVTAGRQAHREQLERVLAELEQVKAGRQAHREQLERVLAELEQVKAGRQAHREQLERSLVELEQVTAQLKTREHQMQDMERELALARKGLLGILVRCKIRLFGGGSNE
jgi:FkbM family methyltransferase